jgi:branched-chain amino acid transport system ATP-binding protein
MNILELRNISKSWGGNKALRDVSMEMESGIVGIVGPNGAGKTTLVNIIAGQNQASSGKVFYKGTDITSLPSYRRARMGIVKTFQVVRPFRSLTVRENVELFSKVRSQSNSEDILKITGMENFQDRFPVELPFGLLKKLEIAKALSANPDLLLLDEPFGGLGKDDIEKLSKFILDIKEIGKHMVIVEHKISALLPLVDKIVLLDRGETKFDGSVSEFKANEKIGELYFGGIINAGN